MNIDRLSLNKKSIDSRSVGIRNLACPTPEPGQLVEVQPGIWWLQLPITTTLKMVNAYLIDEGDGLTLIDTGSNFELSRQSLSQALANNLLDSKVIKRIVATHFHPDHIGLAGWLFNRDVEFLTSEISWDTARRLWDDQPDLPHPEHVEFLQRAGMTALELAAFRRNRPSTYADHVACLPSDFQPLNQDDMIQIGDRCFQIHIGNGHADGHLTFWSDDDEIAIVGDQILPAVSPNLSVHFTLPDADPIGAWLESCERFSKLGHKNTIILPGHNQPFQGHAHRCLQLIENCQSVIERLWRRLARPATAIECLKTIYRRPLESYERMLLIGETVGYLNHLLARGHVDRRLTKSGQYLWRATKSLR